MTIVAVATTTTLAGQRAGGGTTSTQRRLHPTTITRRHPKGDTRNRRCKLPKTTTHFSPSQRANRMGTDTLNRPTDDVTASREKDMAHGANTISPSPSNGIIGRPEYQRYARIPSTPTGCKNSPSTAELSPLQQAARLKNANKETEIIDRWVRWSDTGRTALCRTLAKKPLVRQEKNRAAPERTMAILEEVHKPRGGQVNHAEVYTMTGSTLNPVMVKKSDGSLRMCVGRPQTFNKALSTRHAIHYQEKDWKVRSNCGYPFKSFFDANKGKDAYCLKIAGATYQRLVDNAFEGQVGRNLEVMSMTLSYERANTARRVERHVPLILRLDREAHVRIKAVSRKTKAVKVQLPSPAHDEKKSQSLNMEVSRSH
ncbi:hypothetical protein Tco_1254495 [Tanacetum coccineum]